MLFTLRSKMAPKPKKSFFTKSSFSQQSRRESLEIMLSLGVVKLILAARNASADSRVLARAHIGHIDETLSSFAHFGVHFFKKNT